MRHLLPLINERLEQEARYGKDWRDKPVSAADFLLFVTHTRREKNDVISWLLDASPDPNDVQDIAIRVLIINFAAIHTTTMVSDARARYMSSYPFRRLPMSYMTWRHVLNMSNLYARK
jgi:hypothetical protein